MIRVRKASNFLEPVFIGLHYIVFLCFQSIHFNITHNPNRFNALWVLDLRLKILSILTQYIVDLEVHIILGIPHLLNRDRTLTPTLTQGDTMFTNFNPFKNSIVKSLKRAFPNVLQVVPEYSWNHEFDLTISLGNGITSGRLSIVVWAFECDKHPDGQDDDVLLPIPDITTTHDLTRFVVYTFKDSPNSILLDYQGVRLACKRYSKEWFSIFQCIRFGDRYHLGVPSDVLIKAVKSELELATYK